MDVPAICVNCKNYRGEKEDHKCLAFPRVIPDLIWSGADDHSTPLEGQKNKIVFEKK